MQNIDIKKIRYVSLFYAVMIVFVFYIVANMFIYLYQKDKVINEAENTHRTLLLGFYENENIADAITTKFTTAMQKGNCLIPNLFKDVGFYGYNYSGYTNIQGINGSLITLKPLDPEAKCLVFAASFILNALNDSDLVTKKGFRYVLSERVKFVYSFYHLGSDFFDIKKSKMFHNMELYVPVAPKYFKRKLTEKLQSKGTVVTPLYTDLITGKKAYSAVSFIYNLNHSDAPIAYLLYDHSAKEIYSKVSSYLKNKAWIGISLVQNDNGNTLCISNCNFNNKVYVSNINLELSEKYTLQLKINVFGSIYSSPVFKLVILMAMFFLIILQYIIKRHMLKTRKDSIIDHLTKLYTRKVISLIKNKNNEKKYISIIDCNHFKLINDIYGHNAGDEVLIFISRVIKSSIRRQDIAIRHGGDEFMLILEANNKAEVENILQRISKRIAEKSFSFNDSIVHTSISYGVVPYSDNLQKTIQKADQEMYVMKKNRAHNI